MSMGYFSDGDVVQGDVDKCPRSGTGKHMKRSVLRNMALVTKFDPQANTSVCAHCGRTIFRTDPKSLVWHAKVYRTKPQEVTA